MSLRKYLFRGIVPLSFNDQLCFVSGSNPQMEIIGTIPDEHFYSHHFLLLFVD
ncbi:hypothetical protein [Spirosoma harenae]